MAVLVSLILGALLLVAFIWWLRRDQHKRLADIVERSRELPPLTTDKLPDFRQSAPPPIKPITDTIQPSLALEPLISTNQLRPKPSTSNWIELVKQLQECNELESALIVCEQQFPKWQAFQQTAGILHVQIKRKLEQKQDPSSLLIKLYRCAVLADLFRSGPSLKPHNPRQTLKALALHDFPYSKIGHSKLKLLRKSDINLLEGYWGQPTQHAHAEVALDSLWQTLCQ